MCKSKLRSSASRDEFNRYNGFGSFSSRGEPCQFHKPIAFKPEEPPVMRMSTSFEARFEVEDGVNLAFHQDRSRHRKPEIELCRPCSIEGSWRRNHRALSGQVKRP